VYRCLQLGAGGAVNYDFHENLTAAKLDQCWTDIRRRARSRNFLMADLVSHPDEIRVISKRLARADEHRRYLEQDGYKAVQKPSP